MQNFDPNRVYRDVKSRIKNPFFNASESSKNKPLPQPAPPTSEEMEKGAELIKFQKLNSSKRDIVLEKVNYPNTPEVLVLSLNESVATQERPKKKQPLLVFRPRLIHRSIFDMLDYYSGKKNYEAGRS